MVTAVYLMRSKLVSTVSKSQKTKKLLRLQTIITDLKPCIPRCNCLLDSPRKEREGLRNIHPYDGLDANVQKMDALIHHEESLRGLPMLLSEFSVSVGTVIHLRLSAVLVRSTANLDTVINLTREMLFLKHRPTDSSLYNKLRNRLGVSAIVTRRKRLGNAIRNNAFSAKKA